MKKSIVFLSILLISSFLSAQSTFTLGPKAGINFAKVTTEDGSFTPESVFGYQGGAFARLSIGRVYLQPELLYIHKSSELINPIDSQFLNKPKSEYTITINSLEVPILIGVMIIKTDLVNVRALVGPVLNIAVSRDLSLKLNGIDTLSTFHSIDDIKSGAFAFNVGVGADFGPLTLDIRYDFGLSDISKKLIFQKLNTFSISLGVKLLN
ncbi:porin family protein [Bacteroidota bacterium]